LDFLTDILDPARWLSSTRRPHAGSSTAFGPLAGYVSTLLKIQAAFEQAGIQFIHDEEIGGFGLRMAKKKRKR
jgi:hypothetical protein